MGKSGYSPPYLLYHFWGEKKSLFLHYNGERKEVSLRMEKAVDFEPRDVAGEACVKAISDIVAGQLELNRTMLHFLERMYNDLREDMKAAQSAADNHS